MSRTFASVDDFIKEGAFGVTTATKMTQSGQGSKCCASEDERTWQFDAARHPASSRYRHAFLVLGWEEVTYDLTYGTWDSAGRPTAGTVAIAECGYSSGFTLSYDDANSTVTAQLATPPGEGCDPSADPSAMGTALDVGYRLSRGFESYPGAVVEATETVCAPKD